MTVSLQNYGMTLRLPLTVDYPKLFFTHSRLWDVQIVSGTNSLHWKDIETSAGVYDWTHIDAVVSLLHDTHGLILNYTFGYTPSFYNSSAGDAVPPTDPQKFYNFATALFTRYKGKIKYYELWNEVQTNNITYWSGTNAQLIAYATALQPILATIDTAAILTTPSITSAPGPGTMDALFQLGIQNYCAQFALHGYAWIGNPGGNGGDEQPWEQYDLIMRTFKAMRDNYAPTMPIHMSEYNYGGNTVLGGDAVKQGIIPVVQQAIYLSQGVDMINYYRFDAAFAGTLYDVNGQVECNTQGLYWRRTQSWFMGADFTAPFARVAGTNGIRNTSMTGAVAGTPGTAPTNWTLSQPDSAKGITTQIVQITSESGYTAIDLRVSGTPTAGASGAVNLYFEGAAQIAALAGQKWTVAAAVKLIAGSMTGITKLALGINENDNSGTFLRTALIFPFTALPYPLGSPLISYPVTLQNGSTAFMRPYLQVLYTVGTAIDITIRIAVPSADNSNVWFCDITRAITSGQPTQGRFIVAADGGPTAYNVPGWATNYRTLDGDFSPISGGVVTLTSKPIMLENATAIVKF